MIQQEKITGKDLLKLGWQPCPAFGIALSIAEELLRDNIDRTEILIQLKYVYETPHDYTDNPLYSMLAQTIIEHNVKKTEPSPIRDSPVPYRVWGDYFEQETLRQLENAVHLPISRRAALMPDGHPGYGLPIGGVLATENAVIPYGVGMDIACRVRLSIFNESPQILNAQRERFKKALIYNTRFGLGKRNGEWNVGNRREHEVLDDPRWNEIPILRKLHDKAIKQLGTSGTSNHFAEWAELDVLEDYPDLGLKAGELRLCFVTHSGSRGMGAQIAQRFTDIAKSVHPDLPPAYKQLSWLDLDTDDGMSYWTAMNLAGDFASACHQLIHKTVITATGLKVASFVENHHNFAWEEEYDGKRWIIHRKGATPAATGELGVIPGTMADKGYVVIGLGNQESLNSSSHGAGRPRSRTASKNIITRNQRDEYLKRQGVELLNPDAGVDEAPQAYKNPAKVMAQQADLVRTIATFMPRIVMMSSDDKFGKRKRRRRGKRRKKR